MSNTLTSILPVTFYEKIQSNQSFVLNILASWCSDCTAQQINIQRFADSMAEKQLEVLQLNVQIDKGGFIDSSHQMLTEQLGGHGFPRTILVLKGEIISSDNVEIISAQDLEILADTFKKQL